MKKAIFILIILLWALGCGGLFSCKSIERAHNTPTVVILPFKVYRVEITETGYHYLWVWRYRLRGRIPATCVENGNSIEVGDYVMIDIRNISVHY